MKQVTMFVIVISLAIAGIQAEIWNQKPQSFSEGKIYSFDYSSQVLTGLPKSSSEYHGLQINGVVELEFESKSSVIMTLSNFKILESNESFRTGEPNEFMDWNLFKEVKLPDPENMNKLSLPVSFKWKIDEKIKDFKVNEKDDKFSVNIKRGIINLLNFKVKINDKNWKEEGGSYTISEDEGIDGNCFANYLWSTFPYITPGSSPDKIKVVSITRSKSANKCKKPVGYDRANFKEVGNSKSEEGLNRTFVKNNNEASLNLTLWKSKKFFVWEVQSTSSYSIGQKNTLKESISSFVVQDLRFNNIITKKKVNSKPTTVKKSLKMDISKKNAKLTIRDRQTIVTMVEELLLNTKVVVPEFIRLLRLADDDDFKEISQKILDLVKTKPVILKPYLDVLSDVLTVSSTKSLINEFLMKPMPHINDDIEMAMRISRLSGLSNVEDPELIDLLTSAVSKEVLLQHKHRINTLKSTWLTIGSLAGTHYANNPKYDIVSTVKYFTKIVPTLVSSLSKDEQSVIILKALGNMGVSEIFSSMRDNINNKTVSLSIRVQSIYSLRKIPRIDSTIEHLMLKVFDDLNEDVEVRLAAAIDICLRHTGKSLNALINRLVREPIKQVKSFMQDFLTILSKLPKLKSLYEPLLRRLTSQTYSSDYSRIYSMPTGNGVLAVSLIYTPENPSIRTGNVIYYDFRFGKLIIPLEVGFRCNGNTEKFKNQTAMDIIKYFMQMKDSRDPTALMMYVKKYDNEIGYFSVGNELRNFFGGNRKEDLLKFFQGAEELVLENKDNRVVYGELRIPTTMGVIYSANLDISLSVTVNLALKLKGSGSQTKLDILIGPSFKYDNQVTVGIDANYITSQFNSKTSLKTPDPIWFTVSIPTSVDGFSILFSKRDYDLHLIEFSMKRKFKISYRNQTNDIWSKNRFIDINPFYVPKAELRKEKSTFYPFPFGKILNVTSFCDVGKPRSEGILISWFSAGDALLRLQLKKKKKSDFDQFEIRAVRKIFKGEIKYVLSVNHLQKGKEYISVDVMTLKMKFGHGNSVTLQWPENILQLGEVLTVKSTLSKKPDLKRVKLSGAIKFPSPLTFEKKSPLKIWTHMEKYSYGFKGTIENSKGTTIHTFELRLGMNDEAKQLGKEISKNPRRYAAHHDLIYQCSADIDNKIPNSPSCFKAWEKLNYYNQFSVSVNWTDEGYARFKKMFNKLNKRVMMSPYLISEKILNGTDKYNFQYKLLPYFQPSSMMTISLYSLTDVYKSIDETRLKFVAKMFQKLSTDSKKQDYKMCQVRKGDGEMISIKTFDDHTETLNRADRPNADSETRRIVFVQDINNSFQMSLIFAGQDTIIQVVGNRLQVLRIVKRGSDITFTVNGKTETKPEIKWDGMIVATMNRYYLTGTTLYDIDLPMLKARVVTDMKEMIDFEVSKSYQSNLRGICGDMDGEVYNEFKNAACNGTFSTHLGMMMAQDYRKIFKDVAINGPITELITLKKCSKYQKLSML